MEWVTKNQAKPYKKIMNDCIDNIRKKIKNDYRITFECFLVGSSKRNLVLRHHNKGFDCDYQIHIRRDNKIKINECIEIFKQRITEYLNQKGYSYEHSTSSLTYKKIDKDNSSIEHSFDIVFIKESENGSEIARHHGNEGWRYEELSETKDYSVELKEIKERGKFQLVKDEYKKEKEANEKLPKEQRRKSYQIFVSSVKEVYKKI